MARDKPGRIAAIAALLALAACRSSVPAASDAAAPSASTPSFDAGPAPRASDGSPFGAYVVAEAGHEIELARVPTGVRVLSRQDVFDAAAGDLTRNDALSGKVDIEKMVVSDGGMQVGSTGKELVSFEQGAWKTVWQGHHQTIYAVEPWKSGLLAAVGSSMSLGPTIQFVVLGTHDAAPTPPKFLSAKGLAASRSGEILVVGGDDRIARWPDPASAPLIEQAPKRKGGDAPELNHVRARSAADAWVGGFDFDAHKRQRPYLAHFDGHAWTAFDTYGQGYIAAMDVGPDGSIWYATDSVYRRFPNGQWDQYSLPAPTDVAQQNARIESGGLIVTGKDEFWVASQHGQRFVVVHTLPGNGVLDLDDGTRLTFAQADKRWSLPKRFEGRLGPPPP